MVDPDTGRIHASFNQTVAATGRLSSSDPNLQNIPVRREQGKEIRQAFLPAEGWTLLTADYSQIELRLLAHFTGDEVLQQGFRRGPRHSCGGGVADIRSRGKAGIVRDAPHGQDGQLRRDLRHEWPRLGRATGHRPRRGQPLHQRLFRPLSEGAGVPGPFLEGVPQDRLRFDDPGPPPAHRRGAPAIRRISSATSPSARRSTWRFRGRRPTSSSWRCCTFTSVEA